MRQRNLSKQCLLRLVCLNIKIFYRVCCEAFQELEHKIDSCRTFVLSIHNKTFRFYLFSFSSRGWSGSAMVVGKRPVPGSPGNLLYSRARASALAVDVGEVCLDILFPHISFLIFLPLSGRRPD